MGIAAVNLGSKIDLAFRVIPLVRGPQFSRLQYPSKKPRNIQ